VAGSLSAGLAAGEEAGVRERSGEGLVGAGFPDEGLPLEDCSGTLARTPSGKEPSREGLS
jgi:hypothetical protein